MITLRSTILILPSLLAIATAQLPCGDCNGDGFVNIVDGLQASRYAAGLSMLTPAEFSACNTAGAIEPDPAADVTIIDALSIARHVVGLGPGLTCYSIPPLTGLFVDGDNPAPAELGQALSSTPSTQSTRPSPSRRMATSSTSTAQLCPTTRRSTSQASTT